MKTSLFTILSLCLLTSTAFAGEHGKGKMKEARKNGEISKEEAATLKAERKEIKEAHDAAKADGTVTSEERAVLKEKRATHRKHAQELATNNVKKAKKHGEPAAAPSEPAKQ